MIKKTKPQKSKNKRKDEYSTIHTVFKSLPKCSSVALRDKLEERYPEIWANTGNDHRSDEKRIRRILDKLVDFELAKKEGIGKEQVYRYIHDNRKINMVHKIANELNINFNDLETYYKRRKSIISLLNDVSDIYYMQTQQEDISKKEKIIKDLESAIQKRQMIEIIHKGHHYKVAPLKIAQFDGFWYPITYNTKYFKYRIKYISLLSTMHETYPPDIEADLKLDQWHNSWHNPNTDPTKVKIFIVSSIFHYFEEKNILGVNTYKQRLTPCSDGTEYDLYINHAWELLPTLMQWQKHINILEQEGKIDIIGEYKKILEDAIAKLPI